MKLRHYFLLLVCSLLGMSALAGTNAQMRYPIVLVHGFSGFDNILGVDYFFRVPQALRQEGAVVYVARVNPAQSTEFRGEELVKQLKEWAARDGVPKFHLMGHSHGGPTVRYAANAVPGMIASVSSIAGAHRGTPLADTWGPLNQGAALLNPAIQFLAFVTGSPNTSQTSMAAAISSISTQGADEFNTRFPIGGPSTTCGQGPEQASIQGHNIRWYSYSGTRQATNLLDPSDALVVLTGLYFKGQPNDGAISRCSSHWGKVIRDDYPWNHLDEINQVLGIVGPLAPSPVAFYIQHANRLKLAGL